MLQRLHNRSRAFIALLCMALVAVVAAQGAIINVDRVQHALDLAHAPTPLAGPVHMDHADNVGHRHDGGHHHEAAASQPGAEATPATDDGGDRPAPHHHLAEGPQLDVPTAERFAVLLSARFVAPEPFWLDAPAQLVTARLDRPPKAAPKTHA